MTLAPRRLLALCLAGAAFAHAACATAATAYPGCPADGPQRAALLALKARDFKTATGRVDDDLVNTLADCLGDPDPALRDGVAYAGLAAWLRADAIDPAARQRLLGPLQAWMADPTDDPAGVRAPFAALVLSEVARTDRIAAWMTPAQRAALVESAARYVEGVRDYRGYTDGEGWRHGVAHGADLLMQLALNPALEDAQLDRLLAAVASQVAPSAHAYVHGEPERLVRPVLFVLQRSRHDPAQWSAWLGRVASPAPMATWAESFQSEGSLARRHNLRQFLLALYAGLRESGDPALEARLPPVVAALRAMG